MAYGFSAVIPLQINEEDGHYVLTKTLGENTKQNLKNLLLTNPGERVMIPDFGVGISRLLFSNKHASIETMLTARIESQVARYMPWVLINNIDYTKFEASRESADNNGMDIKIFYTIANIEWHDVITVSKLLTL
tara:strand:- start:22835 stop:23236 length:402 start_codon:yes stop_codon:yes gene_type:complete